jgi:hypothetical protein
MSAPKREHCPSPGCKISYKAYDRLQAHHMAEHKTPLPGKRDLAKAAAQPAPPLTSYPGLRPLTVCGRACACVRGLICSWPRRAQVPMVKLNSAALMERPAAIISGGSADPLPFDDTAATAVFQDALKSALPTCKAIFDTRPPTPTEKAVAVLSAHRRDKAWTDVLAAEAEVCRIASPVCPPFSELFKNHSAARLLHKPEENSKPQPQEKPRAAAEDAQARGAVVFAAKRLEAEYNLFTTGSVRSLKDLYDTAPDIPREDDLRAAEAKLKSSGHIHVAWNDSYKEKRFTFPDNAALLQQLAQFKFVVAEDLFALYDQGLVARAFKARPDLPAVPPFESKPCPPPGGALNARKFMEDWRTAIKAWMEELVRVSRAPSSRSDDDGSRALLHDAQRRHIDGQLVPAFVEGVQAAAAAEEGVHHAAPHVEPPGTDSDAKERAEWQASEAARLSAHKAAAEAKAAAERKERQEEQLRKRLEVIDKAARDAQKNKDAVPLPQAQKRPSPAPAQPPQAQKRPSPAPAQPPKRPPPPKVPSMAPAPPPQQAAVPQPEPCVPQEEPQQPQPPAA